MLTVTFTQLRNNAKKYFDAVERGQTVEVYRHGRPVAIVSPYRPGAGNRWKQGRPLKVRGVSVGKMILRERRTGW